MALLLDYLRPDPSFCGLDSGCGAVRGSGFGYIPLGFGVLPVPMLGVLAFALLFGSTFIASIETRARVASPLGYTVAAGAGAFIALQAVLGQFCSLCMIVDTSALIIGLATFFLRGSGWEDAAEEEELLAPAFGGVQVSESQRIKRVWRDDSQVYDAPNPLVRPALAPPFVLQLRAWVLLCCLCVGAPVLFPLLVRTSEVPSVITGMYEPGKITFVEFFDFQCPHCQHLSPRLAALVAQEEDVVIRYGYTPLPAHPESKEAARISICAAEQGKEKEVVHKFFETLDFFDGAPLKIAKQIVPDPQRLEECLASERPDERIQSDTQNLKRAGFLGLPTTYVGGIRILGADDDLKYLDALRRVRQGSDSKGLHPWVFWAAVLLVLVAVVLMGRAPPSGSKKSGSP